jgi:serine/threonine protein kinase
MTFENETVLPRFIKEHVIGHHMPYNANPEANHTVYSNFDSLGELEAKDVSNIFPKITDFGAAWRLDAVNPKSKVQNEAVYMYPIQTNYYRAPEVVLGYGWNFSADIWNFGVLVISIIHPEHFTII